MPFNSCSEQQHTTREHPAELPVTYRFHPRFGEAVMVRRRLERGGVPFVVVLQPDGSFACLPAWMTEPQASRFEISAQPEFSLDGLRALRIEVDALLGLLACESKPGEANHDASVRRASQTSSSTKPVRQSRARRRADADGQGRARDRRAPDGEEGDDRKRDRAACGVRRNLARLPLYAVRRTPAELVRHR